MGICVWTLILAPWTAPIEWRRHEMFYMLQSDVLYDASCQQCDYYRFSNVFHCFYPPWALLPTPSNPIQLLCALSDFGGLHIVMDQFSMDLQWNYLWSLRGVSLFGHFISWHYASETYFGALATPPFAPIRGGEAPIDEKLDSLFEHPYLELF